MAHDHHHGHDHDHSHEEGMVGLALGFRIFEHEGAFYWAEAEIAPYVDEPTELGVALVFHPLDGLNPAESEEDSEWPAWPIDIDDELNLGTGGSLEAQFASIVRQLHGLDVTRLRQYLELAKQIAEEDEEDEG
ncbi:MAG: hypothetical protein LBG44_07155 [Gemmatimonadota bacterium]|jgi:hypothetical protein|nr:hypothetical protein [Gemmatimonadota bacterium]